MLDCNFLARSVFCHARDETPVQRENSTVDAREFTQFMRAFEDMVYSTTLRLTADCAVAEDLTQEVFLRAYEHFADLAANPAAGGWLKTVATRLALNHLGRYKKRWRLFSELFAHAPPDGFMPAIHDLDELCATTNAMQRRQLIERALGELPVHQRVPLVLYHFEEMRYEAIAQQLGISLAKVKTDILRGRIALAQRLGVGARGMQAAPAWKVREDLL